MNLLGQLALARSENSTGVPNREWPISARARGRDSIARNSRLIMNDRNLAAGEPIEERRLADVRSSDDRNVRQSLRSVHRGSLVVLVHARVSVSLGLQLADACEHVNDSRDKSENAGDRNDERE